MRTAPHSHHRRPIASFGSVDAALRAATHLVTLDYEPATIGIAPQEFEAVPRYRLRDRVSRGLRVGAVVGAAAVTAIAIIGAASIETLVRALVAAAAGSALGLAWALNQHRQQRWETLLEPSVELRPRRFDVVVGRTAERAEHDLARWWDPEAPRVGRPASRRSHDRGSSAPTGATHAGRERRRRALYGLVAARRHARHASDAPRLPAGRLTPAGVGGPSDRNVRIADAASSARSSKVPDSHSTPLQTS